jgi:hypothetical protein
MKIRALDGTGDFQFGKGLQSYKYENNAIAQNIQTRLLSFLNNCWFDLDAGIDWTRLLGSRGTQKEIELSAQAMILQSYGVIRINRIVSTLKRTSRSMSLQYNIDTIYSSNIESTVEVGQ